MTIIPSLRYTSPTSPAKVFTSSAGCSVARYISCLKPCTYSLSHGASGGFLGLWLVSRLATKVQMPGHSALAAIAAKRSSCTITVMSTPTRHPGTPTMSSWFSLRRSCTRRGTWGKKFLRLHARAMLLSSCASMFAACTSVYSSTALAWLALHSARSSSSKTSPRTSVMRSAYSQFRTKATMSSGGSARMSSATAAISCSSLSSWKNSLMNCITPCVVSSPARTTWRRPAEKGIGARKSLCSRW
mmetsp:Transcript_27853/g.95044  ORF Transcript_27853/g.95044 Transcript_27853/m.95044 type:complete len:244 (-) Transcript_27853:855-1586(-)